MSNFQEQLQDDMENVFCNAAEFGELIDYKPQTGPVFSVKAVVIRNPPEKPGAMARLQVYPFQVDIPKNGIPAKPVLDGDSVKIAGTTRWLTVSKLLDESDPGAWHLIVN